MTPKEIARISAVVDPRIKLILEKESEKAGLSQTEYLERLIEGTLPDRILEEMQAIRQEIKTLRKEIKNG